MFGSIVTGQQQVPLSFNAFISSFTDEYTSSSNNNNNNSSTISQVGMQQQTNSNSLQSSESLQNVTTTHNATMLYSNPMTRVTPPLVRSSNKITNNSSQHNINAATITKQPPHQAFQSLSSQIDYPPPAPQPKLPPLISQAPQISVIQRSSQNNNNINNSSSLNNSFSNNFSFDSSAKSTPPHNNATIISKQPQATLNIPPPPPTAPQQHNLKTGFNLGTGNNSGMMDCNNNFSYKPSTAQKPEILPKWTEPTRNQLINYNSNYGSAMSKLNSNGNNSKGDLKINQPKSITTSNGVQMGGGESYRLLPARK